LGGYFCNECNIIAYWRETGVPVAEFHEFCRNQQKHGHTLNATSTRDTKRAEDLRARINVLSEAPAKWDKMLQRWARWAYGQNIRPDDLAPDHV